MEKRTPTFWGSIAMLAIVIAVLGVSILHYQVAPQIPIVISTILVCLYGIRLRYKWADLEQAMIQGITSGLGSIIILCLIGMLIGVWILNGTVPSLTSYALELISPSYFLVSTLIICSITAIVTGSSWSTMGTVGVALMATAHGMDVPLAMTAGAIISGAFFGDKLSPLSDTTNLAPAVVKVDIFQHIKHMLWTTVPSMIITIIIFTAIGLQLDSGNAVLSQITSMKNVLHDHFVISPWTLLSPLFILILAIKKVKPIPSLVAGLVVAVITTYFVVPGITIGKIMGIAHFGYTSETGVADIDSLLSRGGLSSMMFAVSLIMTALSFGGVIQKIGMLESILNGFGAFLKRKGNVVAATIGSCMGVNFLVGEQYLSIVLPGKIMAPAYEKVDLHPLNLSRSLEDGGTLFHAIVPWGVSGAFIMATLGIGMEYVFYTFLCIINPIIAIIFGYTGIGQKTAHATTQISDRHHPNFVE